jgi:hypothetical protein
MGRDGAGACTIRSQASQLIFGRTWRITLKHARTRSSISATSSPKTRSLRSAEGLRGNGPIGRRDCGSFFDCVGGLKLFELQLQLLDLAEDLLALRAEEHAL